MATSLCTSSLSCSLWLYVSFTWADPCRWSFWVQTPQLHWVLLWTSFQWSAESDTVGHNHIWDTDPESSPIEVNCLSILFKQYWCGGTTEIKSHIHKVQSLSSTFCASNLSKLKIILHAYKQLLCVCTRGCVSVFVVCGLWKVLWRLSSFFLHFILFSFLFLLLDFLVFLCCILLSYYAVRLLYAFQYKA